MKTVVLVGAVVLVLVLDAVASWRLLGSEAHSRAQKAAWLLLVWLVPFVGAILALQVSAEASVPAPVAGSLDDAPNPGIEPNKTGYL